MTRLNLPFDKTPSATARLKFAEVAKLPFQVVPRRTFFASYINPFGALKLSSFDVFVGL